ncbi:MarR family winged helix-turn-helix transcriptional regulator [Acuticoccus kandeliae]|uniref:MarR family winged helix-turn-helix transcriptional regulator n=1 Tax=Acuticoccus kandeliae TaxID=2073160 RepID=UPI000D3EDC73|nr:MarR family transcriptional regulator [Acuticoccus kandeliae]
MISRDPEGRAAAADAKPRKAGRKPAVKRAAKGEAADMPIPHDENAIVQQWQRERPDIDPGPMRLLGILARAHSMTTPFIDRLVAEHGLTRRSFDVLSALRRAGPPFSLTPKQLADSLMLSGAGMTSRLDRLEAQNLIARMPEPTDRRSLKVQLTRKGVTLIDKIIPDIVAAQWQLVSEVGLEETETLVDLLRRLTRALEAMEGKAADK